MPVKSGLILIMVLTQLMGCTTSAWQESLKEAGKQECYQLPAGEKERCLQRQSQQLSP